MRIAVPKNSRLHFYGKRRTPPAAQWASWADALKMIRDRHPAVVDIILDALRRPEESMTIRTVVECAAVLERTGFECPPWEDLVEGRSPGESREGKHSVARVKGAREGHDEIPEGSVSTPFTCFTTSRMTRIDPAPLRALLLRRLRCPFLCQSTVAGLAVPSTPLATTEQLARQQGSWGGEGGLRSRLRQEFAEKGEPESGPTCSCVTWIWPSSTCSTQGGWRWWQMAFPCLEERSLQSTRPWCPLSTGMGRRAEAQPGLTASRWTKHARGNSAFTLNSQEKGAEFDWSCRALKWGGRWSKERLDFLSVVRVFGALGLWRGEGFRYVPLGPHPVRCRWPDPICARGQRHG